MPRTVRNESTPNGRSIPPGGSGRRRRRRSRRCRARRPRRGRAVVALSTCSGRRIRASSKCELPSGQLDLDVAPPHLPGCRVQPEVTDLEDGRPRDRSAARQRPHPRQQLLERERLAEVVIGAAVEACDPVGHGGPRGEHDHRGPHLRAAQAPADLESLHVGEAYVEQDDVVTLTGGLAASNASAPVPAMVTRSPRSVSPRIDQPGELRLVLHQQHPHLSTLGMLMKRQMRTSPGPHLGFLRSEA